MASGHVRDGTLWASAGVLSGTWQGLPHRPSEAGATRACVPNTAVSLAGALANARHLSLCGTGE